MQSCIEDIEQGLDGLRADMGRQLEHIIRLNAQMEASIGATKNLASILQGILDLPNVSTPLQWLPAAAHYMQGRQNK